MQKKSQRSIFQSVVMFFGKADKFSLLFLFSGKICPEKIK